MKYRVTLKYTFVTIVDIDPNEESYNEKLHVSPQAAQVWILTEAAKLEALNEFLDTVPDFVSIVAEDNGKAQAS